MKVLLLTESGGKKGYGHLTRCISLAHGLKTYMPDVKLIFAVDGDVASKNFLKKQGINKNLLMFNWYKNSKKTFNIMDKCDLLLVDSYCAPEIFFKKLACYTFKMNKLAPYAIAIDDYNRLDYKTNMVINPNIYGEGITYGRNTNNENVRYLAGEKYVLLRKEFWQIPKIKTERNIKNVLISFGGVQHISLTKRLLSKLLESFWNFKYHVVVSDVMKYKNFVSSESVKFYDKLSGRDICNLMLNCQIAISGGGQTLNELARAGVPSIGICFSDNQKINLVTWEKYCFIDYIGWFHDKNIEKKLIRAISSLLPKEKREYRSRMSQKFIDGKGIQRVIKGFLREPKKCYGCA